MSEIRKKFLCIAVLLSVVIWGSMPSAYAMTDEIKANLQGTTFQTPDDFYSRYFIRSNVSKLSFAYSSLDELLTASHQLKEIFDALQGTPYMMGVGVSQPYNHPEAFILRSKTDGFKVECLNLEEGIEVSKKLSGIYFALSTTPYKVISTSGNFRVYSESSEVEFFLSTIEDVYEVAIKLKELYSLGHGTDMEFKKSVGLPYSQDGERSFRLVSKKLGLDIEVQGLDNLLAELKCQLRFSDQKF